MRHNRQFSQGPSSFKIPPGMFYDLGFTLMAQCPHHGIGAVGSG